MQSGRSYDHKNSHKLLSKESNPIVNSSFRVYYGGASGSIPFRWESSPGTPKHSFSHTSNIPPLTPPPSFHYSNSLSKKSSKPSLFTSLFPKKTHHSPSFSLSSGRSSSSSSWSSSRSSSACLSPKPSFFKRRNFSDIPSTVSSFDDGFDGNDDHDDKGGVVVAAESTSPCSTLCFGSSSKDNSRGCYQLVSVKNVLLFIIGRHGSAARGNVN